MKILGIDSSGLVASVALVCDEQLLAEYTVNFKKTHSQTLLPMLDEICRMVELSLDELDAVAVAAGPGSFTGLRIGSATAKGLGLALDKPLVEVPTVDGLAYQLFGHRSLICPLMDARRNQVYTGLYRFAEAEGGSRFEVVMQQRVLSVDEIAGAINDRGEPVVLLGDGVPVYRERLSELFTVQYELAPSYCSRQRAASIAALGALYYQEGRIISAREHRPEYLRLSQAERERLEKASGKTLAKTSGKTLAKASAKTGDTCDNI